MGKKGTKRKTKWRTLPLGEEGGGSGNEDDLHDEDQSTTSSIVGGQFTSNGFKRQSFYYKMADKSYRQTRRFAFERFRSREPLVKLESKTFDEEEYTKITTPRQDVLFKKGYFGRKRESSVEETTPSGEVNGEEFEPAMDQIIITNGFVDERGHYLVNGNSYEIYDPYSNTVTVVVGPPPYANGVTQPVLAAVSCQPVPLQPVDWYPPGADWPSQGSAWTPSYPRHHPPDAPNDPAFGYPPPDFPVPTLYSPSAYVVPNYVFGESPPFNGVPLQTNPQTEAQNSQEIRLELKRTRKKSTESAEEEENEIPKQSTEDEMKSGETTENTVPVECKESADVKAFRSSFPCHEGEKISSGVEGVLEQIEFRPIESGQVEKQSHSTQTNLQEEASSTKAKPSGKESHGTQTPPEDTFHGSPSDSKAQENGMKPPSSEVFAPVPKTTVWKPQTHRFGSSEKNFRDDSPKKGYQQRRIFGDDRKLNVDKSDFNLLKVSYAKKAMSGSENANSNSNPNPNSIPNSNPNPNPNPTLNPNPNPNLKLVNGTAGKLVNGNGTFKKQTPVLNINTGKVTSATSKKGSPLLNGVHGVLTTNGTNKANNAREKKSGFAKSKDNRPKATNERTNQKYKERKVETKGFEELENESRSQSEKSWTVSELSSPTELSSGQNTPPEKLIVQKMEQDINKSFQDKLKHNLTKTEKEEGDEEEEEEEEAVVVVEKVEVEATTKTCENTPEKQKGKKKKSKGKTETSSEKTKEHERNNRKKKKKEKESEERKESSSGELPFLSHIRQKELFFGKDEDFITDVNSFLNGDRELLKTLGLDNTVHYSKLPLHSDLLMILPNFGWSRPKLKIEDFFSPSPLANDLFTKRNITNMKSTKPEEFFASVVDSPGVEKTEKKKESQRKASKPDKISVSAKKSGSKTERKTEEECEKAEIPEGENKGKGEEETETEEGKLGIVEAVNSWLQEQRDCEAVLSIESLSADREEDEEAEAEAEAESEPKNGDGNPMHAPSVEGGRTSETEVPAGAGGCIRVANVVSDGMVHVDREFSGRGRTGRMYRSSSWDAKLSDVNIKKHFKFLTNSASFCQDLISDVRNGLPVRSEYATEELCDPKQMVTRYYTLVTNGRMRSESDSENEVFDALEYKFLTRESQEAGGKSSNGSGNGSITDSGVHSDTECSEDAPADPHKEKTCKLQ